MTEPSGRTPIILRFCLECGQPAALRHDGQIGMFWGEFTSCFVEAGLAYTNILAARSWNVGHDLHVIPRVTWAPPDIRRTWLEQARQLRRDEPAVKGVTLEQDMDEPSIQAVGPIGWYVRVTTDEVQDGYYTVLYVVGLPTPEEAEQAVRRVRSVPHETYEVLDQVPADRGPQPRRGEVRFLPGAV